MRALVLVKPGHLELRTVPEPGPLGPDDVLIAPRAAGVCGTDLHLYRRGRIGTSAMTAPHVLGHETAGEVVEVGAAVEGLKRGDRVVIEPGIACGACFYCHRGEYNLCPRVRFLGVPPSDGTIAELVSVPARFVHRMPDALSWADGAMIEPLAIGLQAAKSAGVGPGDAVAVLGAGPIGLMILQAARVRGASTLIALDVAERPREVALAMGAHAALDPRAPDTAERVRELTSGRGPAHVLEAVGLPASVATAVALVRRGGTLTLVGIAEEPGVPVDTIRLVREGITLRTSFRYAHVHPTAIALAAEGRVDVRTFVTHRFAFADAPDAFREIAERKGEVVKALFEIAA